MLYLIDLIHAMAALALALQDNPNAAQVLTVGMVCALSVCLVYLTKR